MKHLKIFESEDKTFSSLKFMRAISNNDYDLVLEQLKYSESIKDFDIDNAFINCNLNNYISPFVYAIQNSRVNTSFYIDNNIYFKILDLLLDYGSDINKVNPRNGYTPLMLVSFFLMNSNNSVADIKYYFSIIQYLIEHDADWNIVDYRNFDFLHPLKYYTTKYVKAIIKIYPEKYQNYLIKYDANKYNL